MTHVLQHTSARTFLWLGLSLILGFSHAFVPQSFVHNKLPFNPQGFSSSRHQTKPVAVSPRSLLPFFRRAGRNNHDAARVLSLRCSSVPDQALLSEKQLVRSLGLDDNEAANIVAAGTIRTAEEGANLFEQGQDMTSPMRSKSVFLIMEGTVKVVRFNYELAVLGRGEFLGETRYLEAEALQGLQLLKDSPLEEVFSRADKDRDGVVNAAEIRNLLMGQGIAVTPEQAEAVVKKLDVDGDGAVSKQEASNAIENLLKVAKEGFRKADADGSGKIEVKELQALLKKVLSIDVSKEQATQVMKSLGETDGLTLQMVMDVVKRIKKGNRLAELFKEFDKDKDGTISLSELSDLLAVVGLQFTDAQVMLLFSSVDMNNDFQIDLQELTSALNRIEDRVTARFGDAMRLFEEVAYNTQKRRTLVTAQCASKVFFIEWKFQDLADFFASNPGVEVKIKNKWASQLAARLQSTVDQIRIDAVQEEAKPKDSDEVIAGDYGFGSDFQYGRKGDYGPLDKAVPGSATTSAIWSFGREYKALRNIFKVGDFKEFVDAISGARDWVSARDSLKGLLGDLPKEELNVKIEELFKETDTDGSGFVSGAELQRLLERVGVLVNEERITKMITVIDTDRDQGVSLEEFQQLVTAIAQNNPQMRIVFKNRGAWLPSWVASSFLFLVETVGKLDQKAASKVESKLKPQKETTELSTETLQLRAKLKLLELDNARVWKREEDRRNQIRSALERAKHEEADAAAVASKKGQKPSGDMRPETRFVEQLTATESSNIILGPYFFLCWLLDVLFVNRPIQRFWFLENVARMPYFSYIFMLTLYEALGWWRASSDVRRIHFAEEWNEVQHLKIMESLGGDRSWFDRFLARHAAIFYFLILNHVWLFSPSAAYNFSELIEFHAVDTYGEFVDANERLLKSLPAPKEAIEYYSGKDLFLFDEFQTGRDPGSRRPKVVTLYDVFASIRDDELEHVKTMFQCQTAEDQIVSPNLKAKKKE